MFKKYVHFSLARLFFHLHLLIITFFVTSLHWWKSNFVCIWNCLAFKLWSCWFWDFTNLSEASLCFFGIWTRVWVPLWERQWNTVCVAVHICTCMRLPTVCKHVLVKKKQKDRQECLCVCAYVCLCFNAVVARMPSSSWATDSARCPPPADLLM